MSASEVCTEVPRTTWVICVCCAPTYSLGLRKRLETTFLGGVLSGHTVELEIPVNVFDLSSITLRIFSSGNPKDWEQPNLFVVGQYMQRTPPKERPDNTDRIYEDYWINSEQDTFIVIRSGLRVPLAVADFIASRNALQGRSSPSNTEETLPLTRRIALLEDQILSVLREQYRQKGDNESQEMFNEDVRTDLERMSKRINDLDIRLKAAQVHTTGVGNTSQIIMEGIFVRLKKLEKENTKRRAEEDSTTRQNVEVCKEFRELLLYANIPEKIPLIASGILDCVLEVAIATNKNLIAVIRCAKFALKKSNITRAEFLADFQAGVAEIK